MKRVVFDAYAILAWVWGEPGAGFVAQLLREIEAGNLWGGVCTINLGEVYYRTCREDGQQAAESDLAMLQKLPWEVISASHDLVWAAARLKGRFPISYADAFALACAEQHGADLVTDDPELQAAEHGVPLRWES